MHPRNLGLIVFFAGMSLILLVPSQAPGEFIRGDVNGNGIVELLPDSIALIATMFVEGADAPPCKFAADVNGDGRVDQSDYIYLLNYAYLGGPEPAAPFPDCGLSDADYDPLPSVTCEDDSGCA